MQKSLAGNIEAHQLNTVINSLGEKDGVEYSDSGDMILSHKSDGEEIKVNLSSAARIYKKGMDVYDRKKEVLDRLKQAYEEQYIDDYRRRKQKIGRKIEHMEENPQMYQEEFMGKFPRGTDNFLVLEKINVHDHLPGLPKASFQGAFEQMFEYYHKDIEEGRKNVGQMKKKIVEMFGEEKKLAAIFDAKY